jgi:hypothetical protein
MDNWYPEIFKDVKEFSPIDGDYIFVNELTTHEPHVGVKSTRYYQTLLVSPELIENIKPEEINQTTDSSVNPIYDKDYEYEGRSTVFVSHIQGLDKVKPLVFSWDSANNISFQIDPMFLLTYGLTPRLTENQIHWDDLSKPDMSIVTSIPKSTYDFPTYSESFVRIKKDYLQDFLMLRKKALIQVFCETRILQSNKELEYLLKGKRFYERTTKFNHYRINRISEDKIFTEVIGFRHINLGNSIPFSKWDRKEKKHTWPDYPDEISHLSARHWDYVYVSDEVLDSFEKDDNYSVCPETGGVSYKNQWSVSRCSRVGRNHIQIELFKLYEGTPNNIITLWNKYAVEKSKVDYNLENIGEKSKRLVYAYLRFGEWLSSLFNHYFELNISSQDLIKLNRKDLNYYDWYNNESVKPITFHLNRKLSKGEFLYRQKQLQLFLVENLVEKKLRQIATNILGIDLNKFKKSQTDVFRSIKLLDLILSYINIANETGLNLKLDSLEINALLENEIKELRLTKLLWALNSLRQLDSHQEGTKSNRKLNDALKVFSIDKNEITNNYLEACEITYDKLEDSFREITNY